MVGRLILAFCFTFVPLCANKGIVVAFAGISGSGKTTMAKTLAQLYGYEYLIEPEENDWPEVITNGRTFGCFSMWMGLRQLWIPNQFHAQNLKSQSKTVILDSYFIKIIGYELDEPGMEWLFPKNDPYYTAFRSVCQLDVEHLPDPDCIILFDLTYDDWLHLLSTRDRQWDKTPGFIESFQETSLAIQHATERLCQERKIPLINFQQQFGDKEIQAHCLNEIFKTLYHPF